jgi:hypothetical protein
LFSFRSSFCPSPVHSTLLYFTFSSLHSFLFFYRSFSLFFLILLCRRLLLPPSTFPPLPIFSIHPSLSSFLFSSPPSSSFPFSSACSR